MSDSWEIIKKPITFRCLIHKYIILNRLRGIRDFSYHYRNQYYESRGKYKNKLDQPFLEGKTPKYNYNGLLYKCGRYVEEFLNSNSSGNGSKKLCCCYRK